MWKLDWLFYSNDGEFRFPPAPARFCEEDSTHCVSFAQIASSVTINSSVFEDISLSCPADSFELEVERSLRVFTDELFHRFPVLTRW
jgi:hypothetical protein